MLEYKNTRFFKSVDREVGEGFAFGESGMCIALYNEAGTLVSRPSTGAADETFGGISITANVPAGHMCKVQELVIDDLIVSLDRTPLQSQILVKIAGVKQTVAVGDEEPSAANTVNLSGNKLYLAAGSSDKELFVQYHYELTVNEANQETGDAIGGANNIATIAMGVVAAGVQGEFATNMFDASADWSGVIHPRMGADGMFTSSGSGTELKNVLVKNTPSSGNSYLVLEMN